jgi:RimJ/RimL family protein N-acetyltransferase
MVMEPDTSSPIINIANDQVALGPLRRELLPLYWQWYNDFAAGERYLWQLRPVTFEQRETIYNNLAQHDPTTVVFTIYEQATLRPIGVTLLDNIEYISRTAEYNIFIGERGCWGKGYGTATTILMLDYGFTLLGLHNIMLKVDSNNDRAIRAYHRAGFKEIGRRREARRRGQETYDVLYMDCLITEFQVRGLNRLIPVEQSKTGKETQSR